MREYVTAGKLVTMDPLKQATYGAVYVIFDDERWLHFSLESVYAECDVILILIANAPWNGPPRSTEGTVQSALSFPDPEKKIQLLRGDWKSETEQRNAGRRRLMEMGIQYCLVVDADEVYDPVQLRRMMVFAPCVPDVDVWHIKMVTYWKSHLYRIDPPEEFQPAVLLRLGNVRFVEHRKAEGTHHGLIPPHVAVMHHLSYARSDEEILTKITSFSHASEVKPDWYERVWKGWDRDQSIRHLNPAYPENYFCAIAQDPAALPPVLRNLPA
jgi:hypothetical protein